jgi:hypothetical protein
MQQGYEIWYDNKYKHIFSFSMKNFITYLKFNIVM